MPLVTSKDRKKIKREFNGGGGGHMPHASHSTQTQMQSRLESRTIGSQVQHANNWTTPAAPHASCEK